LLEKFFEKIERDRFEGFGDLPMIPSVKRLDRSKMIQANDDAKTVLYVLNCLRQVL
jgi:hypothetical protein